MTSNLIGKAINQSYPIEQQSPSIDHIEIKGSIKRNTDVKYIVFPKYSSLMFTSGMSSF